MLADAAAKFVARNTPSWTKIHASNRRLASKTTFSSVVFYISQGLVHHPLPYRQLEERSGRLNARFGLQLLADLALIAF